RARPRDVAGHAGPRDCRGRERADRADALRRVPHVSAMAGDVLLVERQGPIARATLNRPEVRNAFDERLIAALTAWAAEAAAAPEAGEGGGAAGAGAGPPVS